MKSPQDLFNEAMSFFKANKYKEAAQALEKAVVIDERYADALEALGVMYMKLERSHDAIDVFKKLSRIDPDNIMAHTNLSQIYVKEGKITEAEAEQAEARRLTWKYQLKSRQAIQPTLTFDEEISRYKRVIEFDPNDVLGYFSLAGVYVSAKQWKEAEKAYAKALEVNPEHSASYFGLGQSLQEQGKFEEAAQVFEKGIPIAERKGDLIPFKKMSARLNEIREKRKNKT